MKKLLCVFVCILFLSGCGKINTKENKNEIPDFIGFSTDVKTTLNNVDLCASATYNEITGLSVVVNSPESVKGMKIMCKDGECKIDFHELSFVIPHKKLPFTSFFVSLESCAENAETSTFENGCYSYNINGNVCCLYVDEETKHFQKLSINGNDVLFFEKFQYVMGQT